MRLDQLLEKAAAKYPHAPALGRNGSEQSFHELAERATRLCHALSLRGVAAGDRVVLLSSNRAEFVELYFALWELGAVPVPVNSRLRAVEVELIARDSGARHLLVEDELCKLVHELPALTRIAIGSAPAGWLELEALIESVPASSATPASTRGADATIAAQMYTSGTTGRPKGSMLTHKGLLTMTAAWAEVMPLTVRDRVLQVTPLFHVGGLLMMLSAIAGAARLTIEREFEPARVFELIEREGITHSLFVPAMLRWLLADPGAEERRLETLRTIVYGAAPIATPLLLDALRRFRCDFIQGYGLTESSGVLVALLPEDHRFDPAGPIPRRLSSSGRPLPLAEVRVVNEAGEECAPETVGEIVARGETIHAGYWQGAAKPEDRVDTGCDAQGWFHTGDLAQRDADGYIYIVDRLKDMVCVAGENVYPSEVEVALHEHPAVAEAAVIGVPHEKWGEEVLAIVQARPGIDVTERDLIQHCRSRLARFKCPTRVELRDELPRNAAGKLLKRDLREAYWTSTERKI